MRCWSVYRKIDMCGLITRSRIQKYPDLLYRSTLKFYRWQNSILRISSVIIFVCETIGAFVPTAEVDVVFPKTGYAAVLFQGVVKARDIWIICSQVAPDTKQDVTEWSNEVSAVNNKAQILLLAFSTYNVFALPRHFDKKMNSICLFVQWNR